MPDTSDIAMCVQLLTVKEENRLYEAAFRRTKRMPTEQLRVILDWAETTRFHAKMLDLIFKDEIDFWIGPSGEIEFANSADRKSSSLFSIAREPASASTPGLSLTDRGVDDS